MFVDASVSPLDIILLVMVHTVLSVFSYGQAALVDHKLSPQHAILQPSKSCYYQIRSPIQSGILIGLLGRYRHSSLYIVSDSLLTFAMKESATPWATRWDNYLHIFDPRIHWFSLVNSLVIVVFLCVMVSMIIVRSVSRDVRLISTHQFSHSFLI